MNITKKVCIYILVGLITITGTFTSFYKGAYAFEYVGGALAFEEAIKWLLASVGIISAGGMSADYWENHGQEFEDYCIQQNITDTEVANWQLKLCEGVLDKGSECWQAFKEWASTLTAGESSSDNTISGVTVSGISFNDFSFYDYSGVYQRSGYYIYNVNNTKCVIYNYYIGGGSLSSTPWIVFSSSESSSFSGSYQNITIDGKTVYYVSNYNTGYFNPSLSYTIQNPFNDSVRGTNDSIIAWAMIYGSSSSVVDSDFISVQPDVTDLDIISSPIPDTDAQEVAIPMPGVTDSDNEASAEAYDNIVDQVNDGTLELDDAITQVIDTLKIIVYEQETEKIFPKPENEEDQENLDDKINENKDNMGFTLGGLETVFPFCIPWDIYAFINLLRADPVPPKIELPFPNPLDPENPWTVEVDFSDWDDGMKIVRLAEDFLFIIGLAVLTRSLIGAGGGDG